MKLFPSESVLFRTIKSNLEPIRKTFWILFDDKRSKINPTWSEASIRMNSRSDSFEFIPIENSVCTNLSSNWFGLKTWFRFLQIHALDWVGLNKKNFFPFFHPNQFRAQIHSQLFWLKIWFGSIRVQIVNLVRIGKDVYRLMIWIELD